MSKESSLRVLRYFVRVNVFRKLAANTLKTSVMVNRTGMSRRGTGVVSMRLTLTPGRKQAQSIEMTPVLGR